MLESKFKTKLIKKLETLFPGCYVIHTDPDERQGFPDLIILWRDHWAALEGKQYSSASKQPNQEYYVDILDGWSFAKFISPENEEEVLNELQRSFGLCK